jgi:(1->4)-alpha-D-glucan 1-alpha-D-glucosylmutase
MPESTLPQPVATVRDRNLNRIPQSTYRLQLGSDLTLKQVRDLLPYLEKLGVSDLYLSPLFRARAESSHGYDVVDHGTIDPAIGNISDFENLASAAKSRGMGILLDVVPNHMGINDPGNRWWLDVLENGEGAYFADFFDIDWRPAASALQDKVLLPFLGEPFGAVLENGDLQVIYEGALLQLCYGPRRFPLAMPSWTLVLELVLQRETGENGKPGEWAELKSIVTQLHNLPAGSRRDPAAIDQRYREQRIARQRLNDVVANSPAIGAALHEALGEINGEKGNAKSFDLLERLLEAQWYRLAYWRVASDEINYRRFFDINDLAAIRVEDQRVFDAVHRLVAQLLADGLITGLRIDHPDGLRDPLLYFRKLQTLPRPRSITTDVSQRIYVVAEKILSAEEPLSEDWPVSGTTGYDFLNIISRLQVHPAGLQQIQAFYRDVIRTSDKPADVVYESKRAVLFSSMSSELQMLTAALYRLAQQHRASKDFTRPVLQRALREVIACMTVYRTYVRADSWDVSDFDYRTITTAVRMAKRRNRTLPTAVFDYVASVLLLEHPPTISDELAAERRQFALKFQQVSGPVAAKGVEDTAFYRYYPLASLNEVGGELDARPISIDEFHRLMKHRLEAGPHSMSSTSTHDSKRGEDLRARLHVLTEAPDEWTAAFERWQRMNQRLLREIDGDPIPDVNELYLIYQTLVGLWPVENLDAAALEKLSERIVQYMEKALREAKIHTSWLNPSQPYETAVFDFIRDLIGEKGASFRTDLTAFVRTIADAGFVNSMAQLVLKMTLPGVPDFYRGTELWDFNLVDPDNRRPVDYDARRERLDRISAEAEKDIPRFVGRLSSRWPDAEIKLWVTSRCLSLRRKHPDVFASGGYLPLRTAGPSAEHVVAFSRENESVPLIVIVPRHFYQRLPRTASPDRAPGTPQAAGDGTRVLLPAHYGHDWRDQLTGRSVVPDDVAGAPSLSVAELFQTFPVAVLTPQAN